MTNTQTTPHTPLPWAQHRASIWTRGVPDAEFVVAEATKSMDAAFIVRAVNSFDALVEALEAARRGFEHHPACEIRRNGVYCDCAHKTIDAALALAREEARQ